MLHCLFCRPLNSIVKSVQDIATKYKGPSENKKKPCNKIHKTLDSKSKPDNLEEYYYEDLTSNNEFMKRYKLLNGNTRNETISGINIKNDGCIFLKENKASGGNDSKQLSRIDKVISSIKCLTDCVELCGISNVVLSSSHNEWIRNTERKFHKTFYKQRLFKKSRDTYNYIFKEYECLPNKHAPSVLYKICYILDQILSYVGYIALNTWKKNKLNQMKLNKLHTIHLYLLFARKELMVATEFYTANKEQRLVKKKINSLWWALNAAKKVCGFENIYYFLSIGAIYVALEVYCEDCSGQGGTYYKGPKKIILKIS
uniref:Uncharacterized protein n=1 Tax=Rhodnius prolixus TaxID=13249 RepID=T1HNV7_RHOPR